LLALPAILTLIYLFKADTEEEIWRRKNVKN
jgi:hypothetical protein